MHQSQIVAAVRNCNASLGCPVGMEDITRPPVVCFGAKDVKGYTFVTRVIAVRRRLARIAEDT
jgi:hypothetical protein